MSERGRVALIFAVVGAAAASGGYYYFKIYSPTQAKKAAQDEITAWEARWDAARSCLMGPKPASSKTSEALAVREMLPDPWQRDTCTGLISKLTRGPAPDTGYRAIEDAWNDLDKAATKAAGAFAMHISAPVLDKDPLPAALDNLDAARLKLRAAADLPPAQSSGAALPAATPFALADGKDPIASLEIETEQTAVPSAHGFVLFGKTAQHDVQVDLVAGGTPHVARVAQAELRAIPDASWGATAETGAIEVGAFDGSGGMPAPTKLPLPDAQNLTVAAAGGTLAEGVVVYGGTSLVAVGHARASGVTGDAPARILSAVTGTDGDGRVALAFVDTNREIHARIVKPTGGDEPDVNVTKLLPEPPKGTPKMKFGPSIGVAPCLANDRAWLPLSNGEVFGLGGTRPVVHHDPATERMPHAAAGEMVIEGTVADGEEPLSLVACVPDGLLFRAPASPPTYVLCDDSCKDLKAAGAPDMSAVVPIGGKLVALATHGGVLAVWRDGVPTFYGMPEAMRLVHQREWPLVALTDGKSIDVLARGATGYFVIRVPAK